MLTAELRKIKEQLEAGEKNIQIDPEKLLAELNELDSEESIFQESLALSQKVCPACGRRL